MPQAASAPGRPLHLRSMPLAPSHTSEAGHTAAPLRSASAAELWRAGGGGGAGSSSSSSPAVSVVAASVATAGQSLLSGMQQAGRQLRAQQSSLASGMRGLLLSRAPVLQPQHVPEAALLVGGSGGVAPLCQQPTSGTPHNTLVGKQQQQHM